MLVKIYLIFGIMLLSLYGLSSYKGWEFSSGQRQYIPADVRSSPGGFRSFHFWHSGFHGGK